MSFDYTNPLHIMRAIFGAALGIATVVLLALFVTSGHWDWRLFGLIVALWTFWGVFHDLVDLLLRPVAGFFANLITGEHDTPGPPITIEEETAYLERLLQGRLPPHNEILSGIRLAEIYRTHQRDQAKADAVIERFLAKYPDAPELRFVAPPRPHT